MAGSRRAGPAAAAAALAAPRGVINNKSCQSMRRGGRAGGRPSPPPHHPHPRGGGGRRNNGRFSAAGPPERRRREARGGLRLPSQSRPVAELSRLSPPGTWLEFCRRSKFTPRRPSKPTAGNAADRGPGGAPQSSPAPFPLALATGSVQTSGLREASRHPAEGAGRTAAGTLGLVPSPSLPAPPLHPCPAAGGRRGPWAEPGRRARPPSGGG